MNNLIALLLCFVVGFIIFIGALIAFKVKNKQKLLDFSIALALSVLLTLGFIEILPESFELISSKLSKPYSYITVFLLALFGIIVLKLLDKFVPDHSNEGKSSKKVFAHIAIVTSLAVFLHNIIEGMALYSAFIVSFKTGVIFSLGIAFHNIALGLAISTEFYESNNDKKKTLLLMFILAIATFIGAIFMLLFNIVIESNFILGIVLSITLGMILYIVFFELLMMFINSKNKRISALGFIVGILLMIITSCV